MRRALHLLPLILLSLSATGCELVGDLFELAFWMLAIGFIVLLAVIWWGARKVRALFRRDPVEPTAPPPPPNDPPVV